MSLYLRLTLALLVGGVVCIFIGQQERKEAVLVKAEPDVMPCSVFQTRGPTDNHHVTVTHFTFADDFFFCYEEQRHGAGYSVCFVPVYPLSAEHAPENNELRVLLQLNNVRDDDDLVQRISEVELTGVAIRTGSSLDVGFQKLLREGYPGIDVAQCRVLHVNRRLPNAQFGMTMMFVGTGLLLGFAGIVAWSFSGGGGSSFSTTAYKLGGGNTTIPVVGQDVQDDDEMEQYRQQFAEKYGIAKDVAENEPVGVG